MMSQEFIHQPSELNIDWRESRPSFIEKLDVFVRQNAERLGDITFKVGSQEEKIKSFKVILMTASPAFERMINDSAEESSDISSISLPDVQANVFKAFLELLLKEEKCTDYLQDLNLVIEDLVHLLQIAKKWKVADLQNICKNYLRKRTTRSTVIRIYSSIQGLDEADLENALFDFIKKDIDWLVTTEQFIRLPKEGLEQLLNDNHLVIEEKKLFEGVCAWAEHQCEKFDIDKSGPNIRGILGNLLLKVRFPLMSPRSFAVSVLPKNVLTKEEVAALYTYMALSEVDRESFDINGFVFNTEKRVPKYSMDNVMVINFFEKKDQPPFICDGKVHWNRIRADKRIVIFSLGFLGPINDDHVYQVAVDVRRGLDGKSIGRKECGVFAKQQELFFVEFDYPVVLEGRLWYWIDYALQGADTQSTASQYGQRVDVNKQGVHFSFQCHSVIGQLSTICFSGLEKQGPS